MRISVSRRARHAAENRSFSGIFRFVAETPSDRRRNPHKVFENPWLPRKWHLSPPE